MNFLLNAETVEKVNDFTVPMALVDFIPVIFFAIGAVILMRDLYNKMSKGAFAVFATGMINVTLAGALKATYKLLYAAGICDFAKLEQMFLPTQSFGFLLAGVGVIAMLCFNQSEDKNQKLGALVAPPVFGGTFVFIGSMVAGLGMLDTILCILAKKLGKAWIIGVFAFSFVCCLCMGYLSSQDFAEASMNWIAEGVNTVGQGAFLVGTIALHKAGLADLSLAKED